MFNEKGNKGGRGQQKGLNNGRNKMEAKPLKMGKGRRAEGRQRGKVEYIM